MYSLEDLLKQITFITESYVYGMKVLENEKLKKKKIKITSEHIRTLLDGIRSITDHLYAVADETDYTLRCKILEFLIIAYDNLAKCVKFYHYTKTQEVFDEFTDIGLDTDSDE